jgi:hypothetical protein
MVNVRLRANVSPELTKVNCLSLACPAGALP